MLKNKSITNKLLSDVIEDVNFSGFVFAKTEMEIAFQSARGHSNRADELLNNLNTTYAKIYVQSKKRGGEE